MELDNPLDQRKADPEPACHEWHLLAHGGDIRVRSQAMQNVQPLYVLLPPNYDPSGKTRYPVLYLLHGALGGYTDWERVRGFERL